MLKELPSLVHRNDCLVQDMMSEGNMGMTLCKSFFIMVTIIVCSIFVRIEYNTTVNKYDEDPSVCEPLHVASHNIGAEWR